MSASALDSAVRAARRRLGGQRLLDRLAVGWAFALAAALAWVVAEPLVPAPALRWWMPAALVLAAAVVAIIRTVRDYPAPLAAALELDARFGLKERVTAAVELAPDQQTTPVGRAVVADADAHAATLDVRDKFPLRLRRAAALVPLFGGLLAVAGLAWHPLTDTGLVTPLDEKPLKPGTSDTAVSPMNPLPQPNPDDPSRLPSEKAAAIRADLDRLEREARAADRATDTQWLAEVTAAGDAARSLEREAVDRLARMEAQLKQLEPLAKSPAFKDGPAGDAASSLAAGDLAKAEKALGELAKAAAANPTDPQLRKQLDDLKAEVGRAAADTAAKEKLGELVAQAKKEGRDTRGLQEELDRVTAGANDAKPLKDLADKLDAASQQLRKGNAAEAAKQLQAAADAVRAIGEQAKAAQDARGQAQRADQLRADAAKPGTESGGTGGLSDPTPPGKPPPGVGRDVRPRVPFVDPKGPLAPAGSGGFGGGFTPTTTVDLAPRIAGAAAAAPAAPAGQPLDRDDRDAVREFFERLGGTPQKK